VLPKCPRNIAGRCRSQYLNPERVATVSFGAQGIGAQFDDDVNTPSRVLPKYGRRPISRCFAHRGGALVTRFFTRQDIHEIQIYNVADVAHHDRVAAPRRSRRPAFAGSAS